MRSPQSSLVLMPGDLYFGDYPGCIRTLLGSCVAIVLWHPHKRIGGMCHYVLPTRNMGGHLDARYADEAMQLFLKEMLAHHTQPHEYQAKLFGGANMFPQITGCLELGATGCNTCSNCQNVACRNRRAAYDLVRQHDLTLCEADLGGNNHRHVEFVISTGVSAVKQNRLPRQAAPARIAHP